MRTNLTDAQLIELAGGTAEVSRLCEVSMAAVAQWKRNGIPRDKLVYMAARIEHNSKGFVSRKDLYPDYYEDIWPELQS
jgi:DNA-binding transcriptional regulator YdaS (Cro superfamily)